MATGRMLHKKIGLNKLVHNLSSDTCRLAYTWTIPHLDRDGRLHADPEVLKSLVFPRRSDITVKQMAGFIKEWSDAGLIVWYEAEGDVWLWFPTFAEDQIGLRYDREPPSLAPPPEDGGIITGILPEQCRKPSGKQKEEEITPSPSSKPDEKNVLYIPLARLLFEEHQKLDEKYLSGKGQLDNTLKRWANDIRLLVETDGRNIDEVRKVIQWTQEPGNFWNANILSGAKLRKQYPRLIMQMDKKNGKEIPKKETGWICKSCGKENFNTMSFCTYCKEERPDKKV